MLKSVPRKPAHTRLRDNRCILLSYVSARQYRRYFFTIDFFVSDCTFQELTHGLII